MSRGRLKQDPRDLYDTPLPITEQLLRQWRPRSRIRRVLEPCAGNGAMLEPLFDRFPLVDSLDIAPGHPDIIEADFLDAATMGAFAENYDLIISNPPFRLAQPMIDRGLELLRRQGTLMFLLRLSFLESAKRNVWWRTRMPSMIHVLPSRPHFYTSDSGSTSDAASYAWFEWRNDRRSLRAPTTTLRILAP